VEGLGLETVGVTYDKTGVKVNERLQTTNPKIFAAGDICSPFKFTHTADAQAQIVIQNALFPHPLGLGYASTKNLIIPWATYTEPEIAHVGLYEKDAKTQGIEIDTFTFPLNEVDRAILDGEDEGFARVHVKKGTDTILGATIVAAHAGEMISESHTSGSRQKNGECLEENHPDGRQETISQETLYLDPLTPQRNP